ASGLARWLPVTGRRHGGDTPWRVLDHLVRIVIIARCASCARCVPHGVSIDGAELFYSHVRVQGGPAPVRRFLPDLIDLILRGEIDPGQVFDLTLPLDQVAEGYKAMDERRVIKALLQP
ncbi:MAG: hypothetical protein ACR2MP_09605, partial [Streptosporangiaceae bacterium]